MKDLFTKAKMFFREEEGASAVEYGLLVAGIAVVVMASIYLIGTNLNTKFSDVASQLSSGGGGGGGEGG
ncbi:MAG: Flp family type IVb pilin [Deltaproteobacteria bacterium]|nr:Flp family type IVb pilin [Deltaproteobacteria bacterium]